MYNEFIVPIFKFSVLLGLIARTPLNGWVDSLTIHSAWKLSQEHKTNSQVKRSPLICWAVKSASKISIQLSGTQLSGHWAAFLQSALNVGLGLDVSCLGPIMCAAAAWASSCSMQVYSTRNTLQASRHGRCSTVTTESSSPQYGREEKDGHYFTIAPVDYRYWCCASRPGLRLEIVAPSAELKWILSQE